jgi:hypothetical protein
LKLDKSRKELLARKNRSNKAGGANEDKNDWAGFDLFMGIFESNVIIIKYSRKHQTYLSSVWLLSPIA